MQKIDISYAFYCNRFCCGGERVLPIAEFEKYIENARMSLNGFGAEYSLDFEEDIKLCLCEMAEVLYSGNRASNIKSESIDGYSVTFEEPTDRNKRLREIALKRLGETGLLYAGVDCGD